MSRHPNANAEATRKLLIESAETEFLEHGYEEASLRRICARAGYTTGALYHFVGNKEALLEAVVAPAAQSILTVLDTPFEANGHCPTLAAQQRVIELAHAVGTRRPATRILLESQGHRLADVFEDTLGHALVTRLLELASFRNPALPHTRTLAPEVAYWLALGWARRTIQTFAQADPNELPSLAEDIAFSTYIDLNHLLCLAERELSEAS